MKKKKAKQGGPSPSKRRYKRYPLAMQQSAVERMKLGVNVSVLAEELNIDRSLLYYWRKRWMQSEEVRVAAGPADLAEQTLQDLRAKIAGLEAELGRAALETRFFKGALRRIEESRRSSTGSGGTASTPKSEARCKRKAN